MQVEGTYGTGTFMFDGSTPADLDLNDGDEIEFYETQVGGGWGCA
ncbi:hypothetical protein HU200_051693 [Digitaria exilis]|uniref:Ubiquitin-like domain-containing protein n=1 Tax=Digitaria exilis TaxID=1010633 RepID=A0A835ARQ5_9POAL|nr:hypothetical protein HU200_051693 [Digitaria exilis]